jgi:hypothetical protein
MIKDAKAESGFCVSSGIRLACTGMPGTRVMGNRRGAHAHSAAVPASRALPRAGSPRPTRSAPSPRAMS